MVPSTHIVGVESLSTSVDLTKKSIRILPKRRLLKDFNVNRQKQLTINEKNAYQKVVSWSKKTAKLTKKVESLTQSIKLAEKCHSSESFSALLKNVNDDTYRFILSQINNQMYHPRGRRFSLDDKMLALSLFKASGRGYKLLSKVFASPSRLSLTNLLAQMPFVPGVNKKMFEALKASAEKLYDLDKFCILMFDEVSLQTNVQYNSKSDIIEALSTAGSRLLYENHCETDFHLSFSVL